jgi:hypothetical protein
MPGLTPVLAMPLFSVTAHFSLAQAVIAASFYPIIS